MTPANTRPVKHEPPARPLLTSDAIKKTHNGEFILWNHLLFSGDLFAPLHHWYDVREAKQTALGENVQRNFRLPMQHATQHSFTSSEYR
jgi:hypothetical protein